MNLKNYERYLQELKQSYSRDNTLRDEKFEPVKGIKTVVIKSPNIEKLQNKSWTGDWNFGKITEKEFSHIANPGENSVVARFVAVNLKDDNHIVIFGNSEKHIHIGLMNYLDDFLSQYCL